MENLENSIIRNNKYMNNEKSISLGSQFWNSTAENGLSGIVANLTHDGYLIETESKHKFLNFSSCSYLDLDLHPKIIEGAIAALRKYGVMDHNISRVRIQLPALLELENRLSNLFRAKVISALSASSAAAGILPLIASGHLSNGRRPVMIFDKNCHFSMNLFKPVCGDETLVLTSPHNDLNYIEDVCKRYKTVAYICDGAYSMGGMAPVDELIQLQNKYDLILYFDDSHSLSVVGVKGEGFVRSKIKDLNEKTIIVATLDKAFGTSGAAIMFGPISKETELIVGRFGGPLGWSQTMNIPAIGASLASADIHDSPELKERQQKLKKCIDLFDEHIKTEQAGNHLQIKLIKVSDNEVMNVSKKIYKQGFYVSPVFFPIVARGNSGLRVMLRAREEHEILNLINAIKSSI